MYVQCFLDKFGIIMGIWSGRFIMRLLLDIVNSKVGAAFGVV